MRSLAVCSGISRHWNSCRIVGWTRICMHTHTYIRTHTHAAHGHAHGHTNVHADTHMRVHADRQTHTHTQRICVSQPPCQYPSDRTLSHMTHAQTSKHQKPTQQHFPAASCHDIHNTVAQQHSHALARTFTIERSTMKRYYFCP